jgi:uncharacterized protein YqeY
MLPPCYHVVMTLKQQIEQDLKVALLSGDKVTSTTLRSLKGAILNAEISTGTRETGLSDDDVIDIVSKEVKKRNEAAELYTRANDSERAAQEQNENKIIEKYLPKQLTEEELLSEVNSVLAVTNKDSYKNIGLLIKSVQDRTGKQATSERIVIAIKSVLESL